MHVMPQTAVWHKDAVTQAAEEKVNKFTKKIYHDFTPV